MDHKFNVKVNQSHTFQLSEEDINHLDISKHQSDSAHVLKDNKSFETKVVETNLNSKTYTVVVNGSDYKVTIEDELDQLIAKMGFAVGSSKKVNSVKAPMPGLILDIVVKEAQEVNEGDNLVILEAMKMENVITSPRDGVIKSISVSKTETVEKNQLLIEFE
ncbi:biotin/lipoyl-containing protein [Winogradskyella sp. 3972H.M.0a.05]|uniref:acetyl-CoA carboxylase biotin carboxyl carrier protein subunit n=1 Tax=Winogradskyella sp. 3972H.M.0a.05 TaxID=2950277 RepID=UPI003391C7C4